MKLNRYAPLLACGITAIGVACSTMPPDPDYATAPKVVAIYSVDALNGSMPDVLVYSATEPTKVSKAPPSYNGFRVEFDQPMSGDLANPSELSTAAFCTTKAAAGATAPIQLLDVTDSNRDLPSSVCYDPSSSLGSNPHVTVVVGNNAAQDAAAASPFTCQVFSEDTNDITFKVNQQYAIKVDPARVVGRNGKALDAPNGGVFSFTTADFDIMAEGYQDQNTGYFVWQNKPYVGFMKDLAPVASGQFVMPADFTPYLIATTLPSDTPEDHITVTRADGSELLVGVDNEYEGGLRMIEIYPAVGWEPGTTYKITIAPDFVGENGKVPLTAAHEITFTTAAGDFDVLASAPGAGATAVAVGSVVQVEYNVRIDPATVTTSTVVLKDAAGNSIPGTVSMPSGGAGYIIQFTPTPPAGQLQALLPSTTYTLTATGLKTGPACTTNLTTPANCLGSVAGKDVATTSLTFTTSNFRLNTIRNGSTSINNSTTQSPTVLIGGNLRAEFTDPPSTTAGENVTTDTLKLFELRRDATTGVVTPTQITAVAIAAVGTSNVTNYSIKVTDPAFVLKFGQAYGIRAETSIKDVAPPAGSGVNLKAEACTKTGADCFDQRGFTTAKIGASIAFTGGTGATTGAAVTFTGFAIDTASLGSQSDLNSRVRLYEVTCIGKDDNGADVTIKPVGQGSTAVCPAGTVNTNAEKFAGQITCTLPTTATATGFTCTFPGTLDPNKLYRVTAVIPKTAPVLVPAQLSGFNTDRDVNSPTGGYFFGTLAAQRRTACAP